MIPISNETRRGAVLCVIAVVGVFAVVCQTAAAAPTAGVRWLVSFVAQPSVFVVSGHNGGEPVDQYSLMLTNTGSMGSGGPPVSVAVALPAGVTLGGSVSSEGWECPTTQGSSIVSCTYAGGAIGPLSQSTVLTIPVAVSTEGIVTASVSVSGGEAPVAVASRITRVVSLGAPPPQFEFVGFSSSLDDMTGAADLQAGAHPFALTTALYFSQRELELPGSPLSPVGKPRDVEFDLPAGFVGNPQAVTRCTIVDVYDKACPPSSRVGTLLVNFAQGLFAGSGAFPIYNVVPEHGFPAEFGVFLTSINLPAFLYASVGPGPTYNVHVSAPSIPATGKITSVIASFFGDPESFNGAGNEPVPFLTNPSDCSGSPLTTAVKADSWEQPETWIGAESSTPPVVGCNLLQFHPSFTAVPETAEADEPSGYTFDLRVPQSQPNGLEGLATPPVKNVTVRLPAGVSVNPSAAEGLVGCQETGSQGINLEGPESEAPNANGVLTSVPGHCPPASQVATLEAETPLLPPHTLTGRAYLAQPKCGGEAQPACTQASATNGELYGLYLEIEGAGVIVKLHGRVSADPTDGQLTATFDNNPQLPFSDLKLSFTGGPRAPLANPPTCGQATTVSDITPWSAPETPDAFPLSTFTVTGCEGYPFNPGFEAGTTSTNAGAYTPFTATFTRPDRQQNLDAIQVTTPPGLLGMLSHVTLCEEPQAAQGTCPESAKLGTASAAAGAGSHPFWVKGPVYLTGPYKGAPFGLSIAIPAKAGPFNLGTVVVRSAITIDAVTSALTVTSDPLPQILDGVPLRVQTVNVTVDRPQFMFNPTSCTALHVTGTLAATQGATSHVSSPFAAGGCRNLAFKPRFSVSTTAQTSRAGGASLDVKVSQAPGEANIHRVDVQLPKALPSRLSTLQKACTEKQFDQNPAGCPAGSYVGIAKATTPVLQNALTGPAILVSHGGAAFPDLVVALQTNERGSPIRIDLTGHTEITKGVTYSRFETVPDAPISSFELRLPQGPHSVLGSFGSLCAKPLLMPTMIEGQNAAVVKRSTRIHVTGCHTARNVHRARHAGTRNARRAARSR